LTYLGESLLHLLASLLFGGKEMDLEGAVQIAKREWENIRLSLRRGLAIIILDAE